MNKQEFLMQLEHSLTGLPQEDRADRVAFYSEMIQDRMEEGLSEAQALCEIGPVSAVVSQILAETPLTKLVKETVRTHRAMRAWEIVLLVLGSPLWVPLLLAAFSVLLAVSLVLWSVLAAFWSVDAAFAACTLGSMVLAVILALGGNGPTGTVTLSAGICCAGLAILLFFGCKAATAGMFLLTRKAGLAVKSLFVGKDV